MTSCWRAWEKCVADNLHDLALIIKSRFPLVLVETCEEVRMMQLLERAANLERKSRTFLVATSNDVSQLPPELFRPARLLAIDISGRRPPVPSYRSGNR